MPVDVPSDDPAALDDPLAALVAHLRATEEVPVERAAGRWLGEAQAVAEDAHAADLDPAVVRERVARVGDLLAHVDGTGDETADEHVERARELAATIAEA